MPVVALALRDGEGRLLLQKRLPGKHHEGLWEFPGGKVETGETPRLALCREIAEELAITIAAGDLVPALVADDGADGRIVLILYTATRWRGAVLPLDGQEWGWFTFEQARSLALAPMDADFLQRLAN